ncbi:hypothetical protein [Erwinia phage FBB1]|nr:hypothetical protein [Erwinia phage FBB1]
MKRKLKAKYIKQINYLIKLGNGWPLAIMIADRRPRYNEEFRHYAWYDKYSRTKKGRLDGSYEDNFGIKPSRIAHGY